MWTGILISDRIGRNARQGSVAVDACQDFGGRYPAPPPECAERDHSRFRRRSDNQSASIRHRPGCRCGILVWSGGNLHRGKLGEARAIDHRGHGASADRRAAIGYFHDYVDDLHLLVGAVTAEDPARARLLLGHSMGGLIAIRYALAHQDDLGGIIVSGSVLVIDEEVSPVLKRAGALIARLAANLPLLPSRPGILSRDPEIERRFRADPRCYNGRVRAGLAYQMLLAAVDTQARLDQLTLPLLVMHGAEDRLTSPSGSRLLHQRARGADKTLILWPGLRHEIFNEPERDAVIAHILAWLDARIALEARRPTPNPPRPVDRG